MGSVNYCFTPFFGFEFGPNNLSKKKKERKRERERERDRDRDRDRDR